MKYLVLLFVIFTFSCKTQLLDQDRTYVDNKQTLDAKTMKKANSIYYFIRHADAQKDGTSNPYLSKKGKERVRKLVQFFADKKLDTVFTTNLTRTFETANAIAKSKGVSLIFYDPFKLDYKLFVKQHNNNNVLIVGHSNTTPSFVNSTLGLPKYSQMDESNHSDIFKVILKDEKAVFDEVFILEEEVQKMNDAKLSPKELRKVLRERKKAGKNK